ncbi:hypothetical protein T484DRAFT_1767629 [Baffinella frigidus]|nr:hypothetical protein T484DRAFT_1767629 [Cryptophyta sp. CCMP2293]
MLTRAPSLMQKANASQVALNATVRVDAMAAADLILDCPGKSDGSVAAEAGIVAAPLLTLPKRKLVIFVYANW